MYQVVINDKYYVSDVDYVSNYDGSGYLINFRAIHTRQHGKLFESKTQALCIAEQVGGKVIEYIEKKNNDPEEVMVHGKWMLVEK
ncbi:MAG: hypothetical protein KH135_04500 [Firmicutes bacterium]|nr:hypothetical protein [Bacillota bacterium]